MDNRLWRGVRRLWRTVKLAVACLTSALTFLSVVLRRDDRAARGRWLAAACRRALRVLNTRVLVRGPAPTTGLLISNHLGYLDVLVLGSVTGAVFVSRHDVAHWPVFGWFARMGGTLFVRRERRSDVVRVAEGMRRTLGSGQVLVLFPEGTSSDGRSVLPFRSALLEPAVGPGVSLTVAHLHYRLEDHGDVGREVCYYRGATFGPHAWNLLGKRAVTAEVRFKQVSHPRTGRKELARLLHAEVEELGGD